MDDEATQAVTDALTAAGGETSYPALIEVLDFRYHQYLPRVLKRMKAEGTIEKGIDATRRGADGRAMHFIRLNTPPPVAPLARTTTPPVG